MRIIHILADGKELETLDGFVVEREKNQGVYASLINQIERETNTRTNYVNRER